MNVTEIKPQNLILLWLLCGFVLCLHDDAAKKHESVSSYNPTYFQKNFIERNLLSIGLILEKAIKIFLFYYLSQEFYSYHPISFHFINLFI